MKRSLFPKFVGPLVTGAASLGIAALIAVPLLSINVDAAPAAATYGGGLLPAAAPTIDAKFGDVAAKPLPYSASTKRQVKIDWRQRVQARIQQTSGSATGGSGEVAQARQILAGLIAKYPILKGTTVSFGSTPGGYQAVAYYTSGRIVINPNHTASLSRILNHEVWHIIDYRDNGRIDWGENVPPK